MGLPTPEPGLVVRYDYLWRGQALDGRAHGKDRPACVVAVAGERLVLLPITHTSPDSAKGDVGVPIPPKLAKALGLDMLPSWVIVSEFNIDLWPSGIVQIPDRPGCFHYGFLPPGLFLKIKKYFASVYKMSKGTDRSES